MAGKVKGRFYFKKTTNGNLLGEWSNYNSEIFTESCDAIDAGANSYIGEYKSTWQENGEPTFIKLVVKKVNSKFSLQWLKSDGTPLFDGEGMLCDDILIGDYHQVP